MALVTVGAPAPDFELTTDTYQTFRLSEQRGRPVVIYFYPQDDTEGCTLENIEFTDQMPAFKRLGAVVVGISPDSVEEIRAFADAEALTFPLLADPDAAVAKAWGVWGEKTVGDRTFDGVIRSTFVLDGDGVVQRAEYGVDADGHVARLRAELGV